MSFLWKVEWLFAHLLWFVTKSDCGFKDPLQFFILIVRQQPLFCVYFCEENLYFGHVTSFRILWTGYCLCLSLYLSFI